MKGRKKLAVAVTAISIAGLGGGIPAAAAQAQAENEVFQPTTSTSTGGASGVCIGNGSASVKFSAGGAVTGPYPGSFTETGGVGFSRRMYWQTVPIRKLIISSTLTLSIPFTIGFGSTTITGEITNPAGSGGSVDCVNYYIGGLDVSAYNATYTATIKTEGQTAETVTGAAQVSGIFSFSPRVVGTLPWVTLLNFPSPTS
jgi:hypothetical protein